MASGLAADGAAIQLKYSLAVQGAWRQELERLESRDGLTEALVRARRTVPYYQRRFRHLRSRQLEISQFPLTARVDHFADQRSFLSSGVVIDRRHSMFTNGTLGYSLRVEQDPVSWFDLNYGVFAVVAQRIPGLHRRMRAGKECIFLIRDVPHQEDILDYVPTLNCAALRVLTIGKSQADDRAVVAHLRSRSNPLLYGKPSKLIKLLELARMNGTPRGGLKPFAILTSGEALYADQRLRLERWFGCKVYDAYIATESGMIAMECGEGFGLHVRPGVLHTEVLLPTGELRATGCGEIVITNLLNRAMSFVRYQLGDRVEIADLSCPCGFAGQTIVSLLGRETDELAVGRRSVERNELSSFLERLPLKEFQVAQVGSSRLSIRWVPKRRTMARVGNISRELDRFIRARGWEGHVDSVPLDQITVPGGKQRRFVRER